MFWLELGVSLESGVFGVVPNSSVGKMNFIPFDSKYTPVAVNISKGSLSLPSLANVRGKIRAIFEATNGQTFIKDFTKDSSDYFLMMSPQSPNSLQIKNYNGKIMLTWDEVKDIQAYNIKRCSRIDGQYEIIASNITTTCFIDKTPLQGVNYYVISAIAAGNESDDSRVVSINSADTTLGINPVNNLIIVKFDYTDALGKIVLGLQASNEINIKRDVVNISNGAKSCCLVVGLYSPQNKLKSIKWVVKQLGAYEADGMYIKLDLPSDVRNYKIKVLLWNNTNILKPIQNNEIFP